MIGNLIGNHNGEVVEVWRGSLDELRDRFDFEGRGYSLRVFGEDGESVCEWSFE